MDSQRVNAAPPAADEVAPPGLQAAPVVNRFVAVVGLCGAALVMILSLSAFVVGSHDGRSSGPEVGQYASDFSLRDAADQRVSLRQFEGKPLVLLFTTADARELLPHVNAAAAALASGGSELRVLAIHPDASGATTNRIDGVRRCVADLADRLGRPVVSLLDAEDAVAERYDVTRRPEAVVISAKGVILDRGPVAVALAHLPQTLAAQDTALTGNALAVAGR